MQEKTAPSASKPPDITVKPQRQEPAVPAAEKAARAALLRSRLSADSPRANALGRGSFIRGECHADVVICNFERPHGSDRVSADRVHAERCRLWVQEGGLPGVAAPLGLLQG